MTARYIVVSFVALLLHLSLKAYGLIPGIIIDLTGNQTVVEGTNVTFTCIVTNTLNAQQLRSNWFLIFPDGRDVINIRLQGGLYTPSDTNTSLFDVPSLFPGLQEQFTFVKISSLFDMVEVQCFNGQAVNSSFIKVISPFTFGGNVTVTETEGTTGFYSVNIASEGDNKDLSYKWTKDGVQLTSTERVDFTLTGINFIDGQGGMNRSDSGIYRLTISNFAGRAVTYLILDVQYPPTIAGSEERQSIAFEIGLDQDIITCGLNSGSELLIDGNPFPTITWSFDGAPIKNDSIKYIINDNNLIVMNVTRNDTGLYECRAENILGFAVITYDVETYVVPGSPVNIKDDAITNTTAVITWDDPVDTDGLLIYNYIIHLINDVTAEEIRTMDNSTSVTIMGLLPAVSYTVKVAAVTQRLGRLFEGNLSNPLNFTTMNGRPVLNETITSLITDDVIAIRWSILTNGGVPVARYTVDWIVPGSGRFTMAPGGLVEGNIAYLEISLSKILASRTYRYRIQAANMDNFVSDSVTHQLRSSKGLPASPYITRTTISSEESNTVLVSLRAEITGIVSNNVTLIFEITATSNTSSTIRRNFTIIDYVSPNDVSVAFNGLREGVNYTFRSRVFNIYGASEYSSSTARILIDADRVETVNEEDDDDDTTGVIIGAVVGGVLLILVILVLFTASYMLFHHRIHAASYAVNGTENKSENIHDDELSSKIPQYADNPQYDSVRLGSSLPAYDHIDIPLPVMITDSVANEKQSMELNISLKSDEKGQHLYTMPNTEDLTSPVQSAASNTLV